MIYLRPSYHAVITVQGGNRGQLPTPPTRVTRLSIPPEQLTLPLHYDIIPMKALARGTFVPVLKTEACALLRKLDDIIVLLAQFKTFPSLFLDVLPTVV